jgi:hypothetical protein
MAAKRSLVGLALLSMVACGLADYERHIDDEQKRVKLIDEDNRLLDDALEMPVGVHQETKAPMPIWPAEIFVRPPKGVAAVPAKEGPYLFGSFELYRYSGRPGVNVFLAVAAVGDKPAAKEETPEEFRYKVLKALSEFYRREYKADPADFPTKAQPRKDRRELEAIRGPSQPLDFLRIDYNDKVGKRDFFLFFLQRGNIQAAIVYEMPLDRPLDLNRALDSSLKSVDLDNASSKRAEYASRPRRKG